MPAPESLRKSPADGAAGQQQITATERAVNPQVNLKILTPDVKTFANRRQIMFRTTMLLLMAVSCCAVSADEWGSIHGQIVVEGRIPPREILIAKDRNVKDGEVCATRDHLAEDLIIDKDSRGLANVFVYLSKAPKQIHPELKEVPKEAVQIKTAECQYVPRCLICRTKQTIQIASTDSVAHNPHHSALKNAAWGSLIVPRSAFSDSTTYTLNQAESQPFKVTCDFHPRMNAYWLIADHPYADLTDKDGRFQIDNLPVGDHEFRVWHERVGDIHRKYKVSVTAGEPVALPTMSIPIETLTEKALPKP